MFSPMKLLVLVAIIAIIWFGFKAVGRMSKAREAKAKESLDNDDNSNIEDQS